MGPSSCSKPRRAPPTNFVSPLFQPPRRIRRPLPSTLAAQVQISSTAATTLHGHHHHPRLDAHLQPRLRPACLGPRPSRKINSDSFSHGFFGNLLSAVPKIPPFGKEPAPPSLDRQPSPGHQERQKKHNMYYPQDYPACAFHRRRQSSPAAEFAACAQSSSSGSLVLTLFSLVLTAPLRI